MIFNDFRQKKLRKHFCSKWNWMLTIKKIRKYVKFVECFKIIKWISFISLCLPIPTVRGCENQHKLNIENLILNTFQYILCLLWAEFVSCRCNDIEMKIKWSLPKRCHPMGKFDLGWHFDLPMWPRFLA